MQQVRQHNFAAVSFKIPPAETWFVRDSPVFVNRFSDARRISHEPNNTTFEDHYHEFHEIVVIHRGHAVHVINGQPVDSFPGEVFLIRPGMRHHFRDAEALVLTNVMFVAWRLEELLNELREMPGFSAFYLTDSHPDRTDGMPARLVLSADAQEVVRDVTDRMLGESSQRRPGYKTALRGMLIELLVVLGRSRLTVDRTSIEPTERLAVVLSMLHERFFEHWSLSRMAELAGCSIPSLSRHFRASLHTSPTEYLITVRINRARQLLRHTELSVTRIADESGFEDSNYFTRQFKARTGRTPLEFRRGLSARP